MLIQKYYPSSSSTFLSFLPLFLTVSSRTRVRNTANKLTIKIIRLIVPLLLPNRISSSLVLQKLHNTRWFTFISTYISRLSSPRLTKIMYTHFFVVKPHSVHRKYGLIYNEFPITFSFSIFFIFI